MANQFTYTGQSAVSIDGRRYSIKSSARSTLEGLIYGVGPDGKLPLDVEL